MENIATPGTGVAMQTNLFEIEPRAYCLSNSSGANIPYLKMQVRARGIASGTDLRNGLARLDSLASRYVKRTAVGIYGTDPATMGDDQIIPI